MSDHPEHEKLKSVQHLSQSIGEFVEWLGEKELAICCREGDEYWPISIPTQLSKLLADYFEIDLGRLEAEKQQMLDELQTLTCRAGQS